MFQGKTFTMDGGGSSESCGIMPATVAAIFTAIGASTERQFLVRASYPPRTSAVHDVADFAVSANVFSD